MRTDSPLFLPSQSHWRLPGQILAINPVGAKVPVYRVHQECRGDVARVGAGCDCC